MENEMTISLQEARRLEMLNNGLITADRFINKNYLINASKENIVPLEDKEKNFSFIRLYQITKLVYDKKENVNDKLISVYSALRNMDSAALLLISSDGNEALFYIGIRSTENAATASKILEKSFLGNFSGSELRRMNNTEITSVMEQVVTSQNIGIDRSVSCVTVVPAMRDEDKDKFVQGLEKFIDTMKGEKYNALYIAKPVSKEELEFKKRGFEELYSSLSPFAKTSLAYGENYSKAVTSGMFDNFSHSVNNSIANTTGKNTGKNRSESFGTSDSRTLGAGMTFTSGSSSNSTTGYSSGQSWSKAVTEGTADTTTTGTSNSDTETTGNSRTLTIEHQNKSVAELMKKIEEQLKRIEDCEAFGVWECSAYFIADDIQTSAVAANTFQALMLGDETHVENSFINVWSVTSALQTQKVLEYMKYGMHPLLEIKPEQGYQVQYVTPGNYISGKELPLLMGVPHKSVSGLTVSSMAEFGRNVFTQHANKDARKIRFGQVYHMGNVENQVVELDLDSFTSHCFVTGSTGSGKSNTTYCLLEKFMENNVPFLVVEPAKGEYKEEFGAVENINVFSTNTAFGQMLKINPFRFDPNIHVLEHLDRLVEIFNACWEMYAAMPAILKDAMERMYVEKGWDLLNSVYINGDEAVYPTFGDLLAMLPKVIDSSSYSSDSKGDYTGALVTRVKSLTNGISGQIFCDIYDIPDKQLFDCNTVVDLSRVGSSETKSLIMGILVLKLSEYRMANANGSNQGLKHVTVLEEAHNLLKRATPGSGSNVVAKSVEMICNSIAEMRTYGEGFVIVDQSPTAVDIAAIKNTNTKVIMRLPEKSDCEAVGNAVGLDEEQMKEIAKLGKGVAVVMQNNWLESVLTKIDKSSEKYQKKYPKISYADIRKLRGVVVHELLKQYVEEKKMDIDKMIAAINQVDIVDEKREEMRLCMKGIVPYLTIGKDVKTLAKTVLDTSGTRGLFDITEHLIKPDKEDGSKYDVESVKAWKTEFKDKVVKYIEVPDSIMESLIEYLVYAKALEKGDISYRKVYKILFG